MKRETLEALLAAEQRGQPALLITDLAEGGQALFIGDQHAGDLVLTDDEQATARAVAAAGQSRVVETAGRRYFVALFAPPPRLIIVGAVHIAEPLSRMAALADWRVIVVDPRSAWTDRGTFAGITVVTDWPDVALTALKPDAATAVVTLTHDPKLDDPALLAALASPAFYIGALGSRRTHAARLSRLAAAGVAPDALARIHGPVGLAIGAQTPAEIAIAIMAEITQTRRMAAGAGR
jgi:xanthine dehydrogenase accessory factor